MPNITSSPRFHQAYSDACSRIRTVSDEMFYVRRAQQGDREARNILFCKMLPLLHKMSVAIKSKYNATTDEMIDSAFLGMQSALIGFDPTKSRFESYFMSWAFHMMMACAYESILVHYPYNKIKRINNKDPEMQVNISSLNSVNDYGIPIVDTLTTKGVFESTDQLAIDTEKNDEMNNLKKLIDSIKKNKFTPNERTAFEQLFEIEDKQTLRSVANTLGVSHERIRQLRNSSIAKIKAKACRMKKLKELY